MEKRNVSVLIPYKIKDAEIFIFLQKREKDRKVLPDHFSFFGGKIEAGESPVYAMEREIKEEMCFIPRGYEFLGKYEPVDWVAYVYFLKVGENFEEEIKIMEGEYGKFFSENEVRQEPMIGDIDKNILKDLYQILHDRKKC